MTPMLSDKLVLEIGLWVLRAAYCGVGIWLSMLVMRKAGLHWAWGVGAWAPGLLTLIPTLEFLGVLAAPITLVLVWLFAFAEWPSLIDTAHIGRRARSAALPADVDARAPAPRARPETHRLGAEEHTQRGGAAARRAAKPEPACWLLSGFDEMGRTVRLEIGDALLAANADGLIVGRHPQMAQLVINDDSVSRRHARLRVKGQRLAIEDLGSSNGTKVDGERLQPNRLFGLERGMVVEFGAVRLTLSRN
ncbi:MAG: FHA domain-containing protein [Alphaproteobacteria bacterium]